MMIVSRVPKHRKLAELESLSLMYSQEFIGVQPNDVVQSNNAYESPHELTD